MALIDLFVRGFSSNAMIVSGNALQSQQAWIAPVLRRFKPSATEYADFASGRNNVQILCRQFSTIELQHQDQQRKFAVKKHERYRSFSSNHAATGSDVVVIEPINDSSAETADDAHNESKNVSATNNNTFDTSSEQEYPGRIIQRGRSPLTLNPERPRPDLDESIQKGISLRNIPPEIPATKYYPKYIYPAPQNGKVELYDLAMQIIKKERNSTLEKTEKLRQKLSEIKNIDPIAPVKPISYGKCTADQDRARSFLEKLRSLEIEADIHDPEVRWRWKQGDYDMSKPVFRFLAKSRWEDRAKLLLMQRLEQMRVLPDTLATLRPQIDIRLWQRENYETEPGQFVSFKDLLEPPRVQVTPFEAGDLKLLLVLMDPDSPNLEDFTFNQRVLWIVGDVHVSCTETNVDLSKITTVYPYRAPDLIEGGPVRRLTLFAFHYRQPTKEIKIEDAEKFDIRDFRKKYNLNAVGAHMFRAKWEKNTEQDMIDAGITPPDFAIAR